MDLYKDRANAFSRPAVDSLLLMLFFTCFHLRGEMLIKGLPFVKTKIWVVFFLCMVEINKSSDRLEALEAELDEAYAQLG